MPADIFLIRTLLRNIIVSRRYRDILSLLDRLRPVDSGHKLIRFGPKSDGGYLLPEDLNGVSACFSPGVCETSGFELDCANRGQRVFLADASVDGPAEQHPSFQFIKKFLGTRNQGNFITIEHWIENALDSDDGDLLLQMDIEGAEYEIIQSMPQNLLNRFRILIIEFHGLHGILNGRKNFWHSFKSTIEKLLENHICVHIHPNNTSAIRRYRDLEIPDLIEVTFLRRDRSKGNAPINTIPHPLDFDCDESLPHMALPLSWWK